ncbi:biopolymer transporter ExbD [Spirosoma koreense]
MQMTRRRHIPIRIDFTPFVSVAFLLIVFFVLVKTIQRPSYLKVRFPDESATFCWGYPIADASLFLLANNRIGCLTYEPAKGQAEFVETDYAINGIQRFLLFLSTIFPKEAGIVVLVKPTNQASLRNIADLIKIFNMNKRIRFNLCTQLNPSDRNLLQQYKWIRRTGLKLPLQKRMTLPPEWYAGG